MPRKNQELPGLAGAGPGVEPLTIPEIDEHADEYVTLRDKRMKLLAQELTAKEELMKVMKSHKLKVYEYDDHIVEIVPTDETVKVKKKKASSEEEDEKD